MLLYRVLLAAGRPLARVLFRPEVRGRGHVPRRGGVVLCPNHLSGFDSLAIAYALSPRTARNMAKNQLFERPLVGSFVRSVGAFPARDGGDAPGGVAAGAALAGWGEVVVIFPEGARRQGRVRRPRGGAARIALAADVPLVPAALRGTDGWRRLARWRIAFGSPVRLDDLRVEAPNTAARAATRRLWEAVTALEASLEA